MTHSEVGSCVGTGLPPASRGLTPWEGGQLMLAFCRGGPDPDPRVIWSHLPLVASTDTVTAQTVCVSLGPLITEELCPPPAPSAVRRGLSRDGGSSHSRCSRCGLSCGVMVTARVLCSALQGPQGPGHRYHSPFSLFQPTPCRNFRMSGRYHVAVTSRQP